MTGSQDHRAITLSRPSPDRVPSRVYPPGCDLILSILDTDTHAYPFDLVSSEKAVSLEQHLDG